MANDPVRRRTQQQCFDQAVTADAHHDHIHFMFIGITDQLAIGLAFEQNRLEPAPVAGLFRNELLQFAGQQIVKHVILNPVDRRGPRFHIFRVYGWSDDVHQMQLCLKFLCQAQPVCDRQIRIF